VAPYFTKTADMKDLAADFSDMPLPVGAIIVLMRSKNAPI
jgi:hypothetical protein